MRGSLSLYYLVGAAAMAQDITCPIYRFDSGCTAYGLTVYETQRNMHERRIIVARKRLVTRNVHTYLVNVLCLDLEKEETVKKVITLPRTYKKDDILKRASLAVETAFDGKLKVGRVISVEETVKRYGMAEEEFLKYAKEIH